MDKMLLYTIMMYIVSFGMQSFYVTLVHAVEASPHPHHEVIVMLSFP